MNVATFRYYGARVVLDSPYSAQLVLTIKETFERDYREWDPDRKLWNFYTTHHDGRGGIEKIVEVCLAEGWTVRKVFPDGQRTTIYPTGETVSEKQEDLFD